MKDASCAGASKPQIEWPIGLKLSRETCGQRFRRGRETCAERERGPLTNDH